jgi:hypothetical protein
MAEAKDGCVKPAKGPIRTGESITNSKGGDKNDRPSWQASARF